MQGVQVHEKAIVKALDVRTISNQEVSVVVAPQLEGGVERSDSKVRYGKRCGVFYRHVRPDDHASADQYSRYCSCDSIVTGIHNNFACLAFETGTRKIWQSRLLHQGAARGKFCTPTTINFGLQMPGGVAFTFLLAL